MMIIERRLTGTEKDLCKDCIVEQLKHYIFTKRHQLVASLDVYITDNYQQVFNKHTLKNLEKIKQGDWIEVIGASRGNIIDLAANILGADFIDAANVMRSFINNTARDSSVEEMEEDWFQIRILYKPRSLKK